MAPGSDTLALRLKHAREKRGLGSRALARRAGVNEAYPSQIEGGHRSKIEASILAKLAAALEVSLDWLVNGGAPPTLSPFAKPEPEEEAPTAPAHDRPTPTGTEQ